jgi:hypothetical protein
MSIFTSFEFQWPKALKSLFAYASATTYNDQLMAPECSVSQWSFELKCVRCPSPRWACAWKALTSALFP